MEAIDVDIESGVLIVASRRDDRRALFNALDGQGAFTLHTARNVAQARTLLDEQPSIDLLIIDFVDAAAEAVAFCEQLRSHPVYRDMPVLGVLAVAPQRRVWGYQKVPPGVVEWLHSPIDAMEVRARIRAALHAGGASGAAHEHAAEVGDYAFAFTHAESEWVVSRAEDGRIIEVNPAFEKRSGLSGAQLGAHTLRTLLDLPVDAHARMSAALQRDGVARQLCTRLRADAGRDPVEAVTRMLMRDGRMVHVTCLHDRALGAAVLDGLDMLARLQAMGSGDEGLQQGARLLAEGLGLEHVAVYAASPDGAGAARMLALEQCLATPVDAPDALHEPALQLVLAGETVYVDDATHELARRDGFVRAMRFGAFAGFPLTDEHRNVLGALVVGARANWQERPSMRGVLRVAAAHFAFDLDLRRVRQQGRARGLLDGLTGLPNRLLFNDRLQQVLAEARRTGEMFAVMFVDLDRFKSINDSLGHATGDAVLMAAAERLQSSVRPSDTVARYAGDEFTVIVRHIVQHDDVLRIAAKMVRLMDSPLALAKGSQLHVTASIGLSFYPDDATAAEQLLKRANVAMHNAKGMGRNGYQAFIRGHDDPQRQRMVLESKLRQAEKNGELRVYYQPQVDARSEDIVGMEALIRWEHPELGMISPGFFIPLAEESGLIVSLGAWVLRTACAQAHRWQKAYGLPLRLGVNLSALQLKQPHIADTVASVLHNTGLDPRLLELEVTESINVRTIPGFLKTLNALHEMGCHVAIDDFGTGQSSLDYLRRVPADRIKIDQSFVRNIGVDPDDEAIVCATISMAHNLKRAVVAEGVEIEAHRAFLRANKCDELQGYLFCRPLPAAGFERLLAERQRLIGSSSPAAKARRKAPTRSTSSQGTSD